MLANKLYYFSSLFVFSCHINKCESETNICNIYRYTCSIFIHTYIKLLSHVLSKTIGSTLDDFKFRCVWENDVLWEVGQLVYFVCLHQTNTDISGTINMKLNCLTIGIRQKHIELLYVRKPLHNLKKFCKANSGYTKHFGWIAS